MKLRSDPKEIARTIATLFQAGDVVEMRVPKTEHEGTVSGYFTDHTALAKALAGRNGDPGVYCTLNPVVPSLLARCANRVRSRARTTTSDKDIARRRWILIDCDAQRPADISATDEEHEAALARARDIRMALSEEAWPAPIVADSGNGGHLVYSVDLPNDDTSTKLVEGVLKALAAKFNDTAVQVDVTVFNAARITKAYGTPVRKGDDVPDRPHRLSRILEAPNSLVPVSRELLEDLAASVRPKPAATRKTDARTSRFDLEGFIARYLSAREPVAYEGGRKWVLSECPFNPEHQAPDSAIFERADGSIGFKCFHNSCAGLGWKDVRERFEGPRQSRRPPERERAAPEPPPEDQDAPPPRARSVAGRPAPPQILTCAELLQIETPARKMLFDGYPLPARGATLKVGAPKSGKTILAVQEALALARGKALFEYYSVLQPGPVLIVEQDDPDGAVSIKEIVQMAGGTSDLPMYVVPKLPFGFGPALLDWLGEQITKLSLRMVVLDSYTALRGPRGPGIDIVKAEQTELTQLDALAKRLDAGVQVIHHGSKGAAGLDWTQSAAGSFAMAASTEAQIHVSRFSELDGAATERLVRIRGRRESDAQLVLRFRKETLDYEWVLDGAAAPLYPTIEQIRREFGQAAFSPKELSQSLGISRATAFRLVDRLRQAGAIQKRGHGQYFLPR